jgi:hypothetical protein
VSDTLALLLRGSNCDEVLKISYGCGTRSVQTVKARGTVLDIGSSGGIDCFEAVRSVGPNGHVVGIDMTRYHAGHRTAKCANCHG